MSASADVKRVLRDLRRQGCAIVRGGNGHHKVFLDGEMIGVVPVSPSDPRWKKNLAAQLRRKGLEI